MNLETIYDSFSGYIEPSDMKLGQVRSNLRGRGVDSLRIVLDKAYEGIETFWGKSPRGFVNAEDVISMVFEELGRRSRRTEAARR